VNILSLDLGTKAGWASRVDGLIHSGVIDLTPRRFDGGGVRFLRFRQWLSNWQATVGAPELIVYEEVQAHRGTDACQVWGGFQATLTAWCEHHDIPYEGVPVATIKRHITGKGNADKQAVIAAVRILGFAPADDNEADALALLDWALKGGGRQ
jgi:Holliday junction resolvasome RuvABC endonuclease subunit